MFFGKFRAFVEFFPHKFWKSFARFFIRNSTNMKNSQITDAATCTIPQKSNSSHWDISPPGQILIKWFCHHQKWIFLSMTFRNSFFLLFFTSFSEEYKCEAVWVVCHISWGILRYLNKWSVIFFISQFNNLCSFVTFSWLVFLLLNFPECSFSTFFHVLYFIFLVKLSLLFVHFRFVQRFLHFSFHFLPEKTFCVCLETFLQIQKKNFYSRGY